MVSRTLLPGRAARSRPPGGAVARLVVGLLALIALLLVPDRAQAQLPAGAQSFADFINLWFNPAPSVLPSIGDRTPPAVAFFNGSAGPYADPLSADPLTTPTTTMPIAGLGTVTLQFSALGQSFRTGVFQGPDFKVGEEIPPVAGANLNIPPIITPSNKAFWVAHAQKLFANEVGFVMVKWELTLTGTETEEFLISNEPIQEPVRMYHTANSTGALTGAPNVDIGPIPQVIIHFNTTFSDTGTQSNNKFDRVPATDFLMAQAPATGLVVLEYNSTDTPTVPSDFIGIEIVRVVPFNPDSIVEVFVGDRLLPAQPIPMGVTLTEQANVSEGLSGLVTYIFENTVVGSAFGRLWAVRPTDPGDASKLEIFWIQEKTVIAPNIKIEWPVEMDRYIVAVPENDPGRFQLFVRGDPAGAIGPDVNIPVGLNLNAKLMAWQEPIGHAVLQATTTFRSVRPGWSLLRYDLGAPPGSDDVIFELVQSVEHDDANFFNLSPVPWEIGNELIDNFHTTGTLSARGGYLHVEEGDRFDPDIYGLTEQVFAVNTGLLEVWWSALSEGVQWPAKVVRYNDDWPANPEKIIIASSTGTGAIDPVTHRNFGFYVQNNPNAPGYNPNDEHALPRPFGSGTAIFPLRSDLGTPQTSLPFVLLRFQNENNDNWGYRVFSVVAEEAPFFFDYQAVAGDLLQPPFPLNTLAAEFADLSEGVSGSFFEDRKKSIWAMAAGDDGVSTQIIVVQYYYPFVAGFFIPGETHVSGDEIPWLNLLEAPLNTPTDISFVVRWPDNVPELRVGQTLHKPMFGLPDISSQCSVDVIYQQATRNDPTKSSVKIVDPTKAHFAPLDELPSTMNVQPVLADVGFPDLPPHLAARLTYSPVDKMLKFKGIYVDQDLGEDYFLPNVFSDRERLIIQNLDGADQPFKDAVQMLQDDARADFEFTATDTELDSLALTAGQATGTGFVTLVFQNSENVCTPALPVSLAIIQVTCPLNRGEIAVIEPGCVFDEKLTLKHTGDFAGESDKFLFEWMVQPRVGATLPPPPTGMPGDEWTPFPINGDGTGQVDITIQGPGLFTLSDNWFTVRYKPVDPADVVCPDNNTFSDWTEPNLAEGWIKRVLAGINPFDQRFKDLADPTRIINTTVNMLTQAGPRWEGAVALNCDNVDDFGLIEVYETVFQRGMQLSIEAPIPINFPPANDALLLVAGKLADLYTLLGNEAFADAADPTIGFGVSPDEAYIAAATSLHAFENMTSSLIEEELALLRGRDNALAPTVQTAPVYNRLVWNFSGDFGEVAYAINYDIQDTAGNSDGMLTETDARIIYPQGHGDAWGHYTMAIKNYYRLLQNSNFTWVPRAEAILLGGKAVSVDFIDEKKFARDAAARARTGAQIVSLTHREMYTEDPEGQWKGYKDTDTSRNWGLAEWGSRAGQAALFDWVIANAMLPEPVPNAPQNITTIDRASVVDLREVASQFTVIQTEVDKADRGLNPLGLAKNVLPFDIDPGLIDGGETHFEQIYNRAVLALSNAATVFNYANNSTQMLRRQADELDDYRRTVKDREMDFRSRLIETFGTPYEDDIGPTGTYPTGYVGPDIYHFDYVEPSLLRDEFLGQSFAIETQEIIWDYTDTPFSFATAPTGTDVNLDITFTNDPATSDTETQIRKVQRQVTFNVSKRGAGLEKPAAWTGRRRVTGRLQETRSELLQLFGEYRKGLSDYTGLIAQIEDTADHIELQFNLSRDQIKISRDVAAVLTTLDVVILAASLTQHSFEHAIDAIDSSADGAVTAFPTVVGVASDVTSGLRAVVKLAAGALKIGVRAAETVAFGVTLGAELGKENAERWSDIKIDAIGAEADLRAELLELQNLIRNEETLRFDLLMQGEALSQGGNAYMAALAEGERTLSSFYRFRTETAADIQEQRYKDMAYRVFRNDQLQKYRAQFDLAARYAYMAARAYDFETNLMEGDSRGPGQDFMTNIIRSRAIGIVQDNDGDGIFNPETGQAFGDPGLADSMARMIGNWNLVLKGQLGFTNPQTETNRFSMRQELFRLLPTDDIKTTSVLNADSIWRTLLEQRRVDNVLVNPEFQRFARPFSPQEPTEPAIVIPFATTVNFGANFFGRDLAPGDSAYDSTNFATKIRSVGIWFEGYENANLSATPRIYLIPVGADILRSATPGFEGQIRRWTILDQALPVPFPLGNAEIQATGFIPAADSMLGEFADIRRYSSFRAFIDPGGFDPDETTTDSRLIGRSVWNTRWVIIIPAGTLLQNRDEAMRRFIDNVTDIKIFFQTYAFSGN